MVLAVCVEMSGGLGAGSTVYSGSSGEVIGGPVAHGVESSSHRTTRRNPGELVEEIPYLQEHHRLVDLEPSVCVVLPP